MSRIVRLLFVVPAFAVIGITGITGSVVAWNWYSHRFATTQLEFLIERAKNSDRPMRLVTCDPDADKCFQISVPNDPTVATSIDCYDNVSLAFYPKGWQCSMRLGDETEFLHVFVGLTRSYISLVPKGRGSA